MRSSSVLLVMCSVLSVLSASEVSAAPRPVTIFLERDGRVLEHDGDRVVIPKFGGGDRVWSGIVTCVKQQFSPFNIDIVDRRPARGEFITAVIGGRASQLGLDDRSTNGVGPYSPDRVIRNAVVHIFSRVGTGERDVSNLCSVTVHEVSHALGLDHTYKCGDVMSYFLDRCGPRRFLDVEAPCGEDGPRTCGDGKRTQSSYRKVVAAVGLRNGAEPEPEPEPEPDGDEGSFEADPWDSDEGDPDEEQPEDPYAQDYESAPEPEQTRAREPQGHSCGGQRGQRYTVEPVEHDGRRYYVIRRAR